MKRALIIYLLILAACRLSAQIVNYTVTSAADAGANTIRDIIPTAIADANAGKTVMIWFNAPGLCQVADYLPVFNHTAGKIILQKAPVTTADQGFDIVDPCLFTIPAIITVNDDNAKLDVRDLIFDATTNPCVSTPTLAIVSINATAFSEVNVSQCQFLQYAGPVLFNQDTRFTFNQNYCVSSNFILQGSSPTNTDTPSYTEAKDNTMLCRDSASAATGGIYIQTENNSDLDIENNLIKYGLYGIYIYSNEASSVNGYVSTAFINNNRLWKIPTYGMALSGPNYGWKVSNNTFDDNATDLVCLSGVGIKMVNANSFGIPPENTGNIFNRHTPLTSTPPTGFSSNPQVWLFFGSDAVYFVGQNVSEGAIGTFGPRIYIMETLINNPIVSGSPIPIDEMDYPSVHFRPLKPTITATNITGTILTVNYSLIDSLINTTNGPYRVEFFSNSSDKDLSHFLGDQMITPVTSGTYTGVYTLDLSTVFTYSIPSIQQIGATVTSLGPSPYFGPGGLGTGEAGFSTNDAVAFCPQAYSCNYIITAPLNQGCRSVEGALLISNPAASTYSVVWDYGDGSSTYTVGPITSNAGLLHNYTTSGQHVITATIVGPGSCLSTYSFVANTVCGEQPCQDCIESFAPSPGGTYMISGWIKEDGAGPSVTTYTNSKILVNFYTGPSTSYTLVGTSTVTPSGNIIDGWQRGEEKFTIPSSATAIQILLKPNGADAYYDDIRVFPFDGSMKGYVYEPSTMTLVAELDERNYATIYEYDEEKKLIRVKKETERGIMTIKESRNSAPIKQ